MDVILQGKHDRTQSDDIHDMKIVHDLYIVYIFLFTYQGLVEHQKVGEGIYSR